MHNIAKLFTALTFFGTGLALCTFAKDSESTSQPMNIILIMADDLGYETIAANGGRSYQTPHLDRMASQGLRFEHCYSQPLCTPSRVQIMTGQYNVRNYTRFGVLPRGETTFAHLLKQKGYATCIAGKWQLGRQPDAPQHFGFDEALLWQHTRDGRTKVDGQRIDKRFENPHLEKTASPPTLTTANMRRTSWLISFVILWSNTRSSPSWCTTR